MKKQKAKARVSKAVKIGKPRRGRPKKTETKKVAKAVDPRKLLMLEIKADLKRVKKSKKRLTLLLDKAQAEQGALLAALLESLDKIKAELKKTPLKAKTGKRGRPAGKAGKKPTLKPGKSGRKRGRPRKEVAESAAPKKKRGRPAKAVVVDSGAPKKKRGRPRKAVVEGAIDAKKKPAAKKPGATRAPVKKAALPDETLVTPIPKPGMKTFKKAVSKPAAKPEAKEEGAPPVASDQEPKNE